MADGEQKTVSPFVQRITFLGNLGGYVFHLGALVVVFALGIWTYQISEWLQTEQWPALSVADALHWAQWPQPHFRIAALQQANRDLMAAPLSLVLLFGAGIPLWLYSRFCVWLEQRCEPDKAKTGWTEA